MSAVTCLLSHVCCHTSVITCLLSHVCCHMSVVTCLLSHVWCHMSAVTCLLSRLLSHVCYHMSAVTCLLSHVCCNMSVVTCLLSHVCCHVCCHMSVITRLLSHVCYHMYYNNMPKRQNLIWGLFCFEMWRRVAGVRFRDVSKGHGAFVLKPWRFQRAFFLQTVGLILNKTSVKPWNLPTLNPNEHKAVGLLSLCSLSYPQQLPFCNFNLLTRVSLRVALICLHCGLFSDSFLSYELLQCPVSGGGKRLSWHWRWQAEETPMRTCWDGRRQTGYSLMNCCS
jgi:hypothetical protein